MKKTLLPFDVQEALAAQSVLERMLQYKKEKHVAFHMPGHKRNTKLSYLKELKADIDMSEIEGMDDLHQPKEMLKNTMVLAQHLWQSHQSYLSIAGSTAMILAGIRTLTQSHDRVLIARNCHRSVYHAIELCQLKPYYVLPNYHQAYGMTGEISLEELKKSYEKACDAEEKPSLLILTCPNYEGVFSDLKNIVAFAHQVGMKVLVDEAHGAHVDLFGISMLQAEEKSASHFSALKAGADFVVQSLHKTLPAHTSTALCHIKKDSVDESKLRHQLKIFQTSSPNYLMMASLDGCLRYLYTEEAQQDFLLWKENCKKTRQALKALKHLQVFGQKEEDFENIFAYDFAKFVVSTKNTNLSGLTLGQRLRSYGIEVEMMNKDYVLCMSSCLNQAEEYEKLVSALLEIDQTLQKIEDTTHLAFQIEEQCMLPSLAYEKESHFIPFEEAENKIAGEFIWAYPPGIPLIVPGEKITKNFLERLETMQSLGLNLQPQELEAKKIKVLVSTK